jgi:hypothetical protein
MKLRELTNIDSLNVAQSTTVKGGARDTRGSGTTSASTLTLIIKKP